MPRRRWERDPLLADRARALMLLTRRRARRGIGNEKSGHENKGQKKEPFHSCTSVSEHARAVPPRRMSSQKKPPTLANVPVSSAGLTVDVVS